MNSCALAIFAASCICSSDASSVPKEIFSLAEFEKRKLSSNARLTSDLNSLSLTLFILTPSISISPDSIS
jgi:hypothetical protein